MYTKPITVKGFQNQFILNAYRSALDNGIISTLSCKELPDYHAFFNADGSLDESCANTPFSEMDSAISDAVKIAISNGAL